MGDDPLDEPAPAWTHIDDLDGQAGLAGFLKARPERERTGDVDAAESVEVDDEAREVFMLCDEPEEAVLEASDHAAATHRRRVPGERTLNHADRPGRHGASSRPT